MAAFVLIIACTYATMYMCGKDYRTKDHCAGNNIFTGILQNRGCQHERDSDSDESEILSNSISRHEEDDTVDTNNISSTSCTLNSIDSCVRDTNKKSPQYDGVSSSPIQSNIESISGADTMMQDIDLEEGRGGNLPNSIAISKYFSSPFKRSGISPLKSPKIFKRRKHGKFRDEKDRNSPVYARGNTPQRSISNQKQERNHSLANDLMSVKEVHKTNNESPVSYYTSTKYGLNRGRSKEVDISAPDGEGVVECLTFDRQKKRKINVYNFHKDRSHRRLETMAVSSDESSASSWDGDLASPQRPSFEENLREFNDIMVKMESHGIEMSARYDSDDID